MMEFYPLHTRLRKGITQDENASLTSAHPRVWQPKVYVNDLKMVGWLVLKLHALTEKEFHTASLPCST